MENQNGMVSVIVPIYNAAKYIEQTIQSVIKQSYDNWELILVEDGSGDNSIDIINKYRDDKKIILLQHPEGVNLGVSKSRELGIKVAKGDYIAFLDADDIFYPNKLSDQLNIFKKFKDVILVHSKVEILNELESVFKNEFALDVHDRLYEIHEEESWLKSNKICNSTVIVKSMVLKNLQFGLPQLFQFEDWLLWSLIAEKGKFYYQNVPQIKYRIHPTSATTAVLKNKLISPYSKIEYLISFYLLTNSSDFNSKIIEELRESIIYLLGIYSNENLDKVNSFRLDVYNKSGGDIMYVKKYNELFSKYSKLQKEVEEIRKFKNSRIYKLTRKIKNILKKVI
ncbi:glycosyltransferase [Mariniflexile sp. HMF6888]|uniref:glycosyltransferase n=1 Tax=Mariniflexile sp. HMF6888 TaxID=3373086 RepID=UPI00379F9A35